MQNHLHGTWSKKHTAAVYWASGPGSLFWNLHPLKVIVCGALWTLSWRICPVWFVHALFCTMIVRPDEQCVLGAKRCDQELQPHTEKQIIMKVRERARRGVTRHLEPQHDSWWPLKVALTVKIWCVMSIFHISIDVSTCKMGINGHKTVNGDGV